MDIIWQDTVHRIKRRHRAGVAKDARPRKENSSQERPAARGGGAREAVLGKGRATKGVGQNVFLEPKFARSKRFHTGVTSDEWERLTLIPARATSFPSPIRYGISCLLLRVSPSRGKKGPFPIYRRPSALQRAPVAAHERRSDNLTPPFACASAALTSPTNVTLGSSCSLSPERPRQRLSSAPSQGIRLLRPKKKKGSPILQVWRVLLFAILLSVAFSLFPSH